MVEADVSKSEAVDRLAETIRTNYNGQVPHGVVHCAGILLNRNGIEACTEEVWDKTVMVNLKGTCLINRKFVLLMKENGIKGSVVNISSVSRNGTG